ncbi:MAG: FixH family protein, partial [Bacteroidota bacterium]
MSVSAGVYTYVAANSGGGAQVVDDYYDRALAWNDEMVGRALVEALGWTVDVEVGDPGDTGLRMVGLTVVDSTGQGISGLQGSIRIYRPHLTNALAEIPLSPKEGDAGQYAQYLPMPAAGLYDLELRARVSDQAFTVRR